MIHYKGKIFDMVTQRYTLPNGYKTHLEFVRHPGAVLIVPFLSKDRIILLKQFRAVINTTIYELPAGRLNKKERPLDCAKREIVEETNYRAEKMTKLGMIYPVPGYSTEKIIIYKAEFLKPQQGFQDDDEIIRTCVLTKSQVKKLFISRKIPDAKTISGLAFCGWL